MKHSFFIIAFLALLSAFSASAHPGIGIVQDSKGNIYYTDLQQVWKLASDGSKTIAVPQVHTHELYIDHTDNLYGENLWYEGDASKQFRHYLWVLHPNGKLDTAVSPRQAFVNTDFSLVRDSMGNQYWVQRFQLSRFMKENPEGHVTQLAEGFYNNVKWLYATPAGVLYFINGNNLYKIDSSHIIRPVAKELSQVTDSFAFANPNSNILGIWSDQQNNIYVAVFSGQVVKKISPEGFVTTVLKSEGNWSPVSGLFDKNGNLWIMEYNTRNDVRVREIPQFTGLPTSSSSHKQKVILTVAFALGIISAGFLVWNITRKRTH